MRYLAIDPGETSGWATFDETGAGISMGQAVGRHALYEILDNNKADIIIVEDYRIDPNMPAAHAWSRAETIKVIGAIEHYAYRQNSRVVLQDRTIKGIGYKWAGLDKPKNHAVSHQTDAYVHGVYYLQKAGIRRPQQGKGA